MNRNNLWAWLFILVSLALITSCASTQLTNTWSDSSYNKKVSKIMILGISSNASVKRNYEDTLARHLKAQGVQAVSANTILSSDDEDEKEKISAILEEKGFDSILVTRVISKEKEQRYVPGAPYAGQYGYYNGFGSYYDRAYPVANSPGYLVNDTIVVLETNVYETKDAKLIWAVTSETFNPDNIAKEIENLSKLLVSQLKKDSVI